MGYENFIEFDSFVVICIARLKLWALRISLNLVHFTHLTDTKALAEKQKQNRKSLQKCPHVPLNHTHGGAQSTNPDRPAVFPPLSVLNQPPSTLSFFALVFSLDFAVSFTPSSPPKNPSLVQTVVAVVQVGTHTIRVYLCSIDPAHDGDCGDEKLQNHQSGTISALAEDEIIGKDDECDDSYNEVNVGEGFLQMQQAQMPPSDAGNGGFQSSNANVIAHREESMVSQGADDARGKGLSRRPTWKSLPNVMMKRKRPSFASSSLPQELLIKILVKLPPKLLIQFRCVSESWKSLISSPYFISLHTEQAMISRAEKIKERDRMILRILSYGSTMTQDIIYSVHIDDGHFTHLEDPGEAKVRYYHRIVGACNGVFCLSYYFSGSLRSVVLWNPVIKRQVILPCPRAKSSGNRSSLFALGFGFDAHNNDYKVVKIARARKGDVPPEVEVYALSTGHWRKINGNIPHNCVVEQLWPQVFLDGNVHWTAYRQIGVLQDQFENLILAFDVSSELFNEMPLPDCLKNEAPLRLNVTTFEQSIAVVHRNVSGWMESKSFSIWVMKKYGDKKSWNKLYNVDRGTMIEGCTANGGALFDSKNEWLHSYDPSTGWRSDSMMRKSAWFYSEPYVELLALLNEGTKARVMSIESETESECGSVSSYSSYDDGFPTEVLGVEFIEFWMKYIA